ncbi:MAG: tryptophan--tRNA ligase [Candidatus Woesearchaeota archaeon]
MLHKEKFTVHNVVNKKPVEKPVFNPWDVKGDIDYHKLMREFGVEPFMKLPEILQNNLLFRRKKIFAQRGFNNIINAVANKKPFVMMTGLMPTGKFHIGHMILVQQFLLYQSLGAKIYIAVADIEAYNARGQSLAESRKNAIEEYLLNYIALGLKPENLEIYFQSARSQNPIHANAYYRLQNELARHATFNEFKAVYGEISPGKMLSALLQASDMLHPQLPEFEGPISVVVPVGMDQDPHIRLARDMGGRIKTYSFNELCSTYHEFVPGLGGGKMSSSDPTSYVALSEDVKTVEKKIKKYAFSGGKDTIEEHRAQGGNPDIDIAYQWLTFLEEDDKKLVQIYHDYKTGKLLSGELKQILIDKLKPFLESHHEKREQARVQLSKYIQL